MKEIVFLNNNVERWREFEKQISNPSHIEDVDLIAEMYIKITDDLAYAGTYYPKSETENYLNSLALKAHRIIYKTKKEKQNRIVVFWKYEFPLAMFKAQKQIFISFIIFMISVLIGAFSAANDETFVRLILGDSYVNMTIDNIKSGKPMAVYEETEPMMMFLMIAVNNIKVSFLMLLFGLFTSYGTGILLFFNGIMLGSFQYFFYEYNLLYESALSIWIHGTIEISSIVVAGGAGIILGNSFIFPGTYSRKESFIKGVKRSTKIIAGLFPIIAFAAVLESFITRYYFWPDFIKLSIIILSLAFVIIYFFIYPVRLNKRLKQDPEFNEFINEYLY